MWNNFLSFEIDSSVYLTFKQADVAVIIEIQNTVILTGNDYVAVFILKILDIQDAVHTVNAEECGLVTHSVCLREDYGCGLIVDRQEEEVCLACFSCGELNGEVCLCGFCECSFVNDVEVLVSGFCYECVADALRICVVVTVDNSDLRVCKVGSNVFCGACALVRVAEANLEYVVISLCPTFPTRLPKQ